MQKLPIPSAASENLDPEVLLARARRLDRNALGLLHDLYYPDIFRYIHYRLEDIQICEALTGAVFIEFLEALRHRKAPQHSIKRWLLQTAARQVDEQLRKSKPEQVDPSFDATQPEVEEVENWRQRHTMWRALRQLSTTHQHFLALRFSQEHTFEETARLLDLPEERVRILQWQALTALQHKIEEQP